MNSARSALLMGWAMSLVMVGVWSYSWGLTTSLEQTDNALYVADLCMAELRGVTAHLESILPVYEVEP